MYQMVDAPLGPEGAVTAFLQSPAAEHGVAAYLSSPVMELHGDLFLLF
jgi:hypothetical protein